MRVKVLGMEIDIDDVPVPDEDSDEFAELVANRAAEQFRRSALALVKHEQKTRKERKAKGSTNGI